MAGFNPKGNYKDPLIIENVVGANDYNYDLLIPNHPLFYNVN
jgi:hypothetical protein